MTTLIIGANGKIGKDLVAKCVAREIPVRAMVRDESQRAFFESLGADVVLGDLEGDLNAAFEGCEQVVFSAGSGAATSPHKTLLVDLWGSIQAIRCAKKHHIKHFIMVSALKANDPLRGPERIKHYLVARNRADDYLSRSGLPYTLLRPGRLLDTPATGKYGSDFDWSDTKNEHCVISRQDVANLIIELLQQPLPSGRVIDMVNGTEALNHFLKLHA
ncbi:MAG: SDR family oxidoreductase [Oleiphilaceae bacterium]|nr:SDR family oxidoreductase [Oleiphilaceae bacterium]